MTNLNERELLATTLTISQIKEIDKAIKETTELVPDQWAILKSDLRDEKEYGDCMYITSMGKNNCLKIKDFPNKRFYSCDDLRYHHFVVDNKTPYLTYSYEMLNWDKTVLLNYIVEKLRFNIEEALFLLDNIHETYIYTINSNRFNSLHRTEKIDILEKKYRVDEELMSTDLATTEFATTELATKQYYNIDDSHIFEKYIDIVVKNTSVLRFQDMLLSEDTLTSKVTDDMLNTLTIKTTRSNEEHDIEKAVMMTILKSLDIKYSDILKCVDLVQEKWAPKYGERYYSIRNLQKIEYLTNWGLNSDRYNFLNNNYFKTHEEAETKVQEIKKLLNERRD